VTQVVVGVAVTVLASAAQADTLYVDDDGLPGADGLSWDTAYRFLQDALLIACDPVNDVTEIHVAQGTHTPDRDEANPDGTGDREATFQLLNGVALIGGFAGLGAGDPDERNIELYETILSGDLLGNDSGWPNSENSYHVVTGSGTDDTAVLDGVTVTAGRAYGPLQDPTSLGGGMYNEAGHPTVTDCTFSGNRARYGGGMYNWYSNATVTNCTFSDNWGVYDGGGMYNEYSDPTVTSCTFSHNSAKRYGGGIRSDDSNTWMINCTFNNNTARKDGGGADITGMPSDSYLVNCTFTANTALRRGGGVYIGQSNVTLTNCFFGENAADLGGGMYQQACWDSICATTVTACVFEDNTAHGGGGICQFQVEENVLFIGASEFCGNTATHVAGLWTDEGSNVFCLPCDESDEDVLAVPGDYATIQEAVCAARDGAQVVVAPGVYYETVSFAGKAITIRSSDGPDVTTIDGSGTRRGAECVNFEGPGVTLQGFTITNGYAGWGGGMRSYYSSPTVIDCTFSYNTGGGMYQYYGGDVSVIDCRFIGNSADDSGGGLHLALAERATVIGCTFDGNSTGGDAGGMWNVPYNGIVANCTFTGNSAGWGGGAMWNGQSGVVANCLFSGNSAAFGGAIYDNASEATVVNCTFTDNYASEDGGAIFGGDATVANCVIWGNIPNAVASMTAPPVVTFSDVEGGFEGAGNINVDPLFVDPDNGDLHLSPGSSCIDAGQNNAIAGLRSTDLDGNPRFADDLGTTDTGCGVSVIVDIGAYEYQGDPFTVGLGDIDGNGEVNINDFLLLLEAWGSCLADCCLADFNLDGDVGVNDFLILLAHWG
jgi:predicted outer membrane repeat protein